MDLQTLAQKIRTAKDEDLKAGTVLSVSELDDLYELVLQLLDKIIEIREIFEAVALKD